MKAFEIADEFRAIVEADAAFAGADMRTGMSAEVPSFPAIVFDCTTRPVGGSANVLNCEVMMTVHSDAAGNPATHAELVEKLRVKFFGTDQAGMAAARTAIKTALNARGKFTMLGRGHDAPAEVNAAVEATHFKTPVVIACTVKVVAP